MTEEDYERLMFNAQFEYTPDTLPSWRILKKAPFRGDCEDYALTIAWLVAGRSKLRLLARFLTFQAVFWFTLSANTRRPHVVLWHNGRGWIDNTHPNWSAQCRHTRIFPFNLLPSILLGGIFYGVF